MLCLGGINKKNIGASSSSISSLISNIASADGGTIYLNNPDGIYLVYGWWGGHDNGHITIACKYTNSTTILMGGLTIDNDNAVAYYWKSVAGSITIKQITATLV